MPMSASSSLIAQSFSGISGDIVKEGLELTECSEVE
jgi:hypothetical protein